MAQIYRLCRKGQVRLNGKRAAPNAVVQADDAVRIRLGQPRRAEAARRPPRAPRFRGEAPVVLYEDDEQLVLDKPAGLAVQPGTGHEDASVCDWLAVRHAGEDPEAFVPSPVHRLDRWASGVLLVAKRRQAAKRLSVALASGELEKRYLVLAVGVVSQAEATIELPLPVKAQPGESPAAAQAAVTRFRVLGRHPAATLLECRIEHGRNHQIRRHLAAIGHPVAGDRRHGDAEANAELQHRFGLRRMFLHAASIGLLCGDGLRVISAPLPVELGRVLTGLRISY